MASGIPFGDQVENSSGTPVSGAKVYFKIKGTNTNATTYTDSALTVPASNPVVADAAGWFNTYLSPTINYDVEIKSANDAITYRSFSESPSATGSQPVDATLTALAGAGFENRKFPRGSGPDTVQNVTIGEALGEYNVKDPPYNAVGNGTTNDRAAIQAAIDAAATAGGGVVFLPPGTYSVGASGSTAGGQAYSLLLKDKVHLRGAGMFLTTIKAANSSNCDIITTVEGGRKSLMAVTDLTIDGNEANQTDATDFGFGIWAYRIDNLFLDNVRTTAMCKFGFRIEDCDGVVFGTLMCDHPEDDNADGVHFIDTSRVVGGTVLCKSLGDDTFIITMKEKNVSDYNIGQILVEAVAGKLNGMRGLLLSQSDAATGARTMSNIKVNVVAKNCYGNAVDVRSGSFENLDVNVVSDGCARALYIDPGTGTYAGYVRNSRFTVLDANSDDDPVLVLETNGPVSNCEINARIRNPADGTSAVFLRGDSWSGSIDVDYDPNASKASPQNVIVLADVNDSRLLISSKKGTNGLVLGTNSSRNTILLGSILDASTASILIDSGCVTNTFVGGRINGTLTNSGGSTNRFIGVTGAPDDSLVVLDTNAATVTVTGTTSETTLRSVSVPAGRLRTNGILRLRAFGSFNDATDNKTIRLKFGTTTLSTQVYTAGTAWVCDVQLMNVNSASSQRWFGTFNRTTDTLMSLTGGSSSENTANALTLELTGQLANSADAINILGWTVEVSGR
jgi:hypothetical protein